MIRLENIEKRYGDKVLFENITFSLNKAEKCGFVGRNGSGKTTLLKIISNEEEADSGKIYLPKDYKIGYLKQHIQFTQDTIHKEAIKALPPQEQDNIYKAEKILFGLGFHKNDMEKHPNDFSGGYQLRLHLAKVLLSEPDCLLLDEPTNYLDIISINWFIRFLKAFQGECIIISHDRDFLDEVTTNNMALHRGKIFKTTGSTKKLYELILQDEEVFEKTRANFEKKKAKAQAFIERFGAKATKAKQAQSRKKAIEKLPELERLIDLKNLRFSFNEAPFYGKKLLETQNICFSYEKTFENYLIQNLNLIVEKEDRIAIIGENGSGKSTILKLLAQQLIPQVGTINPSENAKIGFFGQTNISRLKNDLTVYEEILSSNKLLNTNQVLSICGLMMFSKDDADKKIAILSGGEKSRVLLGKIIATPCNLLFLDEPTNHLDIESIEALLDALEDFSGSIIIVTHSELILRRLNLNKIIICDREKQTSFLGNYDDFLEKIGWPSYISTKKSEKKAENNKKSRAEIIQEKSKILNVLKKEILNIENQITLLEKQIDLDNSNLIESSKTGDSNQISKLSKDISDNKRKVEELFDKLEKLTYEFENKTTFYEKELTQ